MLLSMQPPARLSGSAISFLETALWGSAFLGSIKTTQLQMCQNDFSLGQAYPCAKACCLLCGTESDRGTLDPVSTLTKHLRSQNHPCQIDTQRGGFLTSSQWLWLEKSFLSAYKSCPQKKNSVCWLHPWCDIVHSLLRLAWSVQNNGN